MTIHRVLVIGGALALAACTAEIDKPLVVDGARAPGFDADFRQCYRLATNYRTEEERQAALVGAGLGAVVGALAAEDDDHWEGAAVGALVGAGAVYGEKLEELDKERRNVLIRCMQNRGHAVIG